MAMPDPVHHRLGFKTRVLLPVAAIIAILFAVTLWTVNVRLTEAVTERAAQNLGVIASVFENFAELRGHDLLLRARNIQSDPRFKAVSQVNDAKTMTMLLSDLIEELNLQAAAYFDSKGKEVAWVGMADAATNKTTLSHLPDAMRGGSPDDFVVLDHRLLEIVEVPVMIGDSSGGALMIGEEIGSRAANDFQKLTGCEQVLYDGDRIIVSTFRDEAEVREIQRIVSEKKVSDELSIKGRRFLVRGGALGRQDEPACRYLLLSSMEPALGELHATQWVVMLIGTFGLITSVAIVRLILVRATAPLNQLQAGAERMGRGDFSQRVEVNSKDEFGDLAVAFNEMSGRLQTSMQNLESSIATLKETRARLIQSEKLSAMGEFISGVAHELNNPLTVLIGFTHLLQESPLSAEYKSEVRQIADASDRCHKIVQNLLSFARQRPPERKAVDLNEVLEGTARFLQYELRTSNVELDRQYEANLPAVMADAHQLQQVFLNLINNARQAIEEAGRKGRITLRTISAAQSVRTTIEDDGPGIPENVINRIFDPFFTTKAVGKGTGLGLSVSYGIIQEHGGDIRVESRPGRGTTFIIDLPAAGEAPEKAVAVDELPAVQKDPSLKRVLVIDDEAALLLLAERMLKISGYSSDTAKDGEIALGLLKVRAFDVVVCDWKMPGMGGREIIDKISALQPQLARSVVIMSGDVLNDQLLEFANEHNLVLLSKPFALPEFRSAIADALRQRS
jgi:signal transduction histidine kinase